MIKQLLLVLLTSSLFVSCAPKVTTSVKKNYPALDYKEEVIVMEISEMPPESAIEVGAVRINDSGFSTNCELDVVIEKAKLEARKLGGNVLKLTEHTPPNFGSTCHRISAKIFRVENLNELNVVKESSTSADSTWTYAKLYMYRFGGTGGLVGYDVYLGDSVIWRAKSNTRQEIIIKKRGMNSLWAKTESKAEIPIDIEFGKEYYIRCSMVMGVMVGRPQLQLVDRRQGKPEYSTIKVK